MPMLFPLIFFVCPVSGLDRISLTFPEFHRLFQKLLNYRCAIRQPEIVFHLSISFVAQSVDLSL